MSDVYDIWPYPLWEWWRTVNEMSDFMSTGQLGNFIFFFCPGLCILQLTVNCTCSPQDQEYNYIELYSKIQK